MLGVGLLQDGVDGLGVLQDGLEGSDFLDLLAYGSVGGGEGIAEGGGDGEEASRRENERAKGVRLHNA